MDKHWTNGARVDGWITLRGTLWEGGTNCWVSAAGGAVDTCISEVSELTWLDLRGYCTPDLIFEDFVYCVRYKAILDKVSYRSD